MSIIVVVIHVVVCIALIMTVLLQSGKGADMGAAFGGGGSNTLFGATGAATFLSKMTTAAAVVFMLTSLVLAYMSGNQSATSILDGPAGPLNSRRQPSVRNTTTQRPKTNSPPRPTTKVRTPTNPNNFVPKWWNFALSCLCAEVVEFGRHAILRG
jgi:preprotein translocase subunit SecG